MTLDATAVALVLGLILPFVVGLVTKVNASKAVKATVGIIVAGIGATIQHAVKDDGTAFISSQMLLNFAIVYGTQVLSYHGLWSNYSINEKVAPNKGIG